MKINSLKSRLIYSLISGLFYASILAFFDYLGDKEFNFKKFIIGMIVFGVVMFFVAKIKNKKEK